jgi:hypothetical protein
MEINRNAPIIARHEITTRAPFQIVWELQARIGGWPQWNPDIVRAELIGPLAVGAVFQWETAGLAIPRPSARSCPSKNWRGAARAGIFSASLCGPFRRTSKAHKCAPKSRGKALRCPRILRIFSVRSTSLSSDGSQVSGLVPKL